MEDLLHNLLAQPFFETRSMKKKSSNPHRDKKAESSDHKHTKTNTHTLTRCLLDTGRKKNLMKQEFQIKARPTAPSSLYR